jgi:hypothetical protein
MRIACPGYTDGETLDLIREVRATWEYHAEHVGQYWLHALDRRRRVEVGGTRW